MQLTEEDLCDTPILHLYSDEIDDDDEVDSEYYLCQLYEDYANGWVQIAS